MVTFALLNVLTGAALGMRFNVGVLFAAMVFSAFIVAGVSFAAGHTPLQTSIMLLVSVTSLQIGYALNVVEYILRGPRAVRGGPAVVQADQATAAFNQPDNLIADLRKVSSRAERHEYDSAPTRRKA
jgi:hypothetical protein